MIPFRNTSGTQNSTPKNIFPMKCTPGKAALYCQQLHNSAWTQTRTVAHTSATERWEHVRHHGLQYADGREHMLCRDVLSIKTTGNGRLTIVAELEESVTLLITRPTMFSPHSLSFIASSASLCLVPLCFLGTGYTRVSVLSLTFTFRIVSLI